MMEVVVYILHGPAKVKEFAEERGKESQDPQCELHNFWRGWGASCVLKPSVQLYLKAWQESPDAYLRQVSELLGKMLHIDPADRRPRAEECRATLNIPDKARTGEPPDLLNPNIQPRAGEIEARDLQTV
jgi:hypothetical protein